MYNYESNLISIITPIYNCEKYIEQTIKSIQNQTYTNYELIIVDDGSTDNSANIIKKIMKNDKKIIYIKQKNSGVVVARNTAIENSKGRYIAFLDSDDLWYREKLEKQIKFMKEKDVAFSYTSYEIIDENNKIIKEKQNVIEVLEYGDLLKQNIIGCLTVMIDRSRIGNIVIQDTKHEDYATWLSILSTGVKAYGINEVLASYRKRSNSLSSNKIKAAIWTWNVYRNSQHLGITKSIWYFSHYAIKHVLRMIIFLILVVFILLYVFIF
ncbi:glycosyltransferase family 2 protein [Terrisporobacter sp.]